MSKLGWLPYVMLAVVGAPVISTAIAVAIAPDDLGVLYLLASIGFPTVLVLAVVGEAKRSMLAGGLLAVLAASLFARESVRALVGCQLGAPSSSSALDLCLEAGGAARTTGAVESRARTAPAPREQR
jgi:hypothetical protein